MILRKYNIIILVLLLLSATSFAQKILIHMDLQQKDHLKAYGIAYWALENGINVEWLLNFRGGSFFMDHYVNRMYREEKQNGQLSVLFAIIGIIIAALGLYGLTSFAIAQRTKEIGIRKTYGATIANIWYLFAREIIILVLISAVIAIPLVYLVADNWLQNYYYRIHLQVFDFLYGFLIAVFIALFTISYRTIKTAQANPTKSLRYE